MDCVCTTTLTLETNPISPDEEIRKAAVAAMKKCVDICNTLGAPILGGVNYAGWGYLTKKPRTEQEWAWGVECMREVAEYAKETGNVTICVECVNRFETHFLNIANSSPVSAKFLQIAQFPANSSKLGSKDSITSGPS